MKRGFYENFNKSDESGKSAADHRIIVRNSGAMAAAADFMRGILTALIYICAIALSSVGLTALLNKPIRDMLIELARKTLFGM